MENKIRIKYVVLLGLAVLFLNSCAGPRARDFVEFANSGVLFTNEAPKVYDYAYRSEVNMDSAKLIEDRENAIELGVSGGPLAETLKKRNDLFFERLEQFNLMKKHALLLRSYFRALANLAAGEVPEKAGTAASNIASQLKTLEPDIGNIKIGGAAVTSLFQPVAEFAVAAFRNSQLRGHLEKHGKTIFDAIELQREMFLLLRDIERNHDKEGWRRREKVELANPLKDLKTDLPANWAEQRLSLLTISPSETPITAAIQAAEELQRNLKSLSSGQGSALDKLERSIIWVDALLQAFEKAQSAQGE
jgi:hypothetical protein